MTQSPSAQAQTQYVEGRQARFAYRRFGTKTGVPLVLALRFRGTMDHWDPAFLDRLAAAHDVIIFDNVGHSRTNGTAPTTMVDLAGGLIDFVDALGLAEIDLLGWSLGGIVVQAATLQRPDLVRRLIVAGSSPGGGVPGMPQPDPRIWQVATKPVNDDEDFLYLFFPDSEPGHGLGVDSLRRLDSRAASAEHVPVSIETMQAQLKVIASTGSSVWDRLGDIAIPVLVANGAHDRMIDAYASYAMATRLPNAKVVLYSDAGHGFLFQHIDDFTREVLDFLAEHPTRHS
ncbi:alpha/beta fold hydrolase [Mycolicibacterium smegmatis]|uniref:Hydrolase, alpha/beta hydrolase fold family protein n=1 Tax=Mycolicibacterium smegmatis (strain MKD8) TaxID=1214915 RepID=A0A2U9Q0X8_MYCSE|nr:alpha/beta hydrolase [Mycolicibacterium smegmatis]AWT57604.1 hydrolase, alpha/beta hydrolase fold family protein [Mycolicibacterium smegmatis MKD8]